MHFFRSHNYAAIGWILSDIHFNLTFCKLLLFLVQKHVLIYVLVKFVKSVISSP